jgi:hypothetical protein
VNWRRSSLALKQSVPFLFEIVQYIFSVAMGILQKVMGKAPDHDDDKATEGTSTPPNMSEHADLEKEAGEQLVDTPVRILRLRIFMMGLIVSIGGLIFGYDTGQISGLFICNSLQ